MKKYCSKCKRFLCTKNFYERDDDRLGWFAWCKGCMKKSPLMSRILVNDDWIQVIEKPSREVGYPVEEDRGFGKVYG